MRIGELSSTVDGYECLWVHAAIAEDFASYLDPDIPFVWLLGHMPQRTGEWWQVNVPLNAQGYSVSVQLRYLTYDLMLETAEFLKNIHQFNDSGLLLIQSQRPMPSSLFLERISEDHQNAVLIQNGATLKIFPPHAIETPSLFLTVPDF